MPTMFLAPTANFLQKTLNGAISDSVATITLSNTTNMQAPGYVVIDRTDSNGTLTPSAREVVSYTGISGNDLTGCTRGADNSTARQHSDGAIVETTPTVGLFNSLATIVSKTVTTDGYIRAINSPVSISIGQFLTINATSIASIADIKAERASVGGMTIVTSINASGASVVGFTTALADPLSITRLAVTSVASVLEVNATRSLLANTTISNSFNVSGASLSGIPWIQSGADSVDVGGVVTAADVTVLPVAYPSASYRTFLTLISLTSATYLSTGSQSAIGFFVRAGNTAGGTYPGGTLVGFHWLTVFGAG